MASVFAMPLAVVGCSGGDEPLSHRESCDGIEKFFRVLERASEKRKPSERAEDRAKVAELFVALSDIAEHSSDPAIRKPLRRYLRLVEEDTDGPPAPTDGFDSPVLDALDDLHRACFADPATR